MMVVAVSLLKLLSAEERRKALYIIILSFIVSVIDVAGIVSIMPFIAVASNPELITASTHLNWLKTLYETNGGENFILALGYITLFLILFSALLKSIYTYIEIKFIQQREYTIGSRLLKSYSSQSYLWHLDKNSADLAKQILSETASVVGGGIAPFLSMISQTSIIVLLVIVLIIVDPVVALATAVALLILVTVVIKSTKKFAGDVGASRVEANSARFKALAVTFGSIKELIVHDLSAEFGARFRRPAMQYASAQTSAHLLVRLPRFVFEAIAFGSILSVILFLVTAKGGWTSYIPQIALYAFAGYKLMPALQQLYGSVTQLRIVTPALDVLCKDIERAEKKIVYKPNGDTIEFRNAIAIKHLSFRYEGVPNKALDDVNIEIQRGSVVAIIGSNGSGKTTLIDIILGLLQLDTGALEIDGEPLRQEQIIDWQRLVAYVPQQIYVSDDTIMSNITFGCPKNQINENAAKRAAELAGLHDFIINKTIAGYDTVVGERGARLSGGQIQRIGIARALYRNPKLLVLDEATSALDPLTEDRVMDCIYNLPEDVTVVIVAHRLTTLRRCSQIHILDNGRLQASGTYDELKKNSYHFQQMTKE